jgi:tricorn protease
MRRTLLAFLCTFVASTSFAAAQSNVGWLRFPSISPDGKTIVFTFKGDLYRVPSTGGAAIPLTVHQAHDFMPVWSHDGKQIAFASDRYGNLDIFVIPATGGEARRLTYHSAAEYPYTFTADDTNVVFGAARLDTAANRLFPTGSQPELYQVPAGGGRPTQVLTTPAEDVRFSRSGQLFLYQDKKGGENVWRKHHTSAITRDIWVYDTKAGTHRKITTFAGEDRNPVWTDGDKAFYYLSEESGTFNVHKIGLDGGKSQQLTSFKKMPVRFLSLSDTGVLCFGYDGDVYTMKAGGDPQKLAVTIAADAKANNDRVVPVTNGAREMVVAPSGKEVAFTVRGDVFVTSVEGGVTKRITSTPENERGIGFSPDGKAIIYASERNGRWGIYEARKTRDEDPYFYAAAAIKEAPVVVNSQQNTQPLYSPDGKELAFIENRNTLRVLTLETKAVRTLLTDKELFATDPTNYFQWSPDSKWLLFDYAVPGIAPGEVGLVKADGKSPVTNLTLSGFSDNGAKWILGGKAMIWFSNRDGLKSVAQSGGTQQDVYAMFFTKDAWDRFKLTKEEYALVKEAEEKKDKDKAKAKADADKDKKDAKDKEDKPEEVAIDFDGLAIRKARLTIHSSSLGDALVSKDGETLYYLASFEKNANLWTTNLRTQETKMLAELDVERAGMEWDKEQKNIFVVADGSIMKVDPASGKREPVKFSSEMIVNADADREAMFDHVWRRTRDTFYTAGYHGVDWINIRPVYAKYLPFISNTWEFTDMLNEMLGELNVSHCWASFSSSAPGDDATASLGVFYDQTYMGAGAKVEEVIKDGPLDKAGMTIKPGMIIESVDGQAIVPTMDIAQLLNRKAGKQVLLVVADGTTKTDVVAKPVSLGAEGRLLYARWVKKNQDEVDRLSNGQLGYIHVPGMNDSAYRTTFEEGLGKYATRKGLVIDTRFNGGGDLVADLAMFLSAKQFFEYTTDKRSNGFEPNFRWTKPNVSLANEAGYSDGHCYAYAYKALKLGTLVGMPVPGTCSFAGWEMLQDGIRWGVPGNGVKDSTTGKFLENLQTEPDIKVMNEYAIVKNGKDQQLEAAVAELMKQIK